MTFPLFLYLVFYTIFGGFNQVEGYAIFLLTGILGMTITADGLFGVGAIIQGNYQNGTIRLLKKMPFNILSYFVGLIINRFVILISLLLFLNLCSFFIAGAYLTFAQLPYVFLGIFIGLWIFSFIGLSLSFLNVKSNSEKGVKNLVYFLVLFSSNALYEIGAFNPSVEKLADYLPLNGVLDLMRMEPVNWLPVIAWMVVPLILFYVLFTKIQYSR